MSKRNLSEILSLDKIEVVKNEIDKAINKLKGFGALNVINSEGVEENITFKIPKELVIEN